MVPGTGTYQINTYTRIARIYNYSLFFWPGEIHIASTIVECGTTEGRGVQGPRAQRLALALQHQGLETAGSQYSKCSDRSMEV